MCVHCVMHVCVCGAQKVRGGADAADRLERPGVRLDVRQLRQLWFPGYDDPRYGPYLRVPCK